MDVMNKISMFSIFQPAQVTTRHAANAANVNVPAIPWTTPPLRIGGKKKVHKINPNIFMPCH